MGQIDGFMKFNREMPGTRDPKERVRDYKEIYIPQSEDKTNQQAARCMDCGVPFCHSGCPLGNNIPDFNDAVYQGKWDDAIRILSTTNNFPEFTGRICPAPCEASCVLSINNKPVTIEYSTGAPPTLAGMPTLLLLRHGRSTANTAGLLAGRVPGVALDDHGREQAAALPERLRDVPLAAVVSSPLQRCRETVAPLLAARRGLPEHLEDRVQECDYGDWSGRKLSELSDEPLMTTVQQHPSAAAFPGGESMREMQHRSVEAVRDWNARIADEHGPDAVYVVCAHGDIIKSVVADALGMHLDLFQRIAAGPCSVTAIRYTPLRPFLLRLGETGELGSLAPPPPERADGSEEGESEDGVNSAGPGTASGSATGAAGDEQGNAAVGGGV